MTVLMFPQPRDDEDEFDIGPDYDVMESHEVVTEDGPVWSFDVYRNGWVHTEFFAGEMERPIGLQALTANDADAIAAALVEAAKRSRRQAAGQ